MRARTRRGPRRSRAMRMRRGEERGCARASARPAARLVPHARLTAAAAAAAAAAGDGGGGGIGGSSEAVRGVTKGASSALGGGEPVGCPASRAAASRAAASAPSPRVPPPRVSPQPAGRAWPGRGGGMAKGDAIPSELSAHELRLCLRKRGERPPPRPAFCAAPRCRLAAGRLAGWGRARSFPKDIGSCKLLGCPPRPRRTPQSPPPAAPRSHPTPAAHHRPSPRRPAHPPHGAAHAQRRRRGRHWQHAAGAPRRGPPVPSWSVAGQRQAPRRVLLVRGAVAPEATCLVSWSAAVRRRSSRSSSRSRAFSSTSSRTLHIARRSSSGKRNRAMWRMIPSNDWIGGLADAADATAAESDDSTVRRVSASNSWATVMAPARDVVARLRTSLLGCGCLAACPAGKYRNGGGGGACTASDLAALSRRAASLPKEQVSDRGVKADNTSRQGNSCISNVLELCLLASFLSSGLLRLPFSQKVFGS